MSEAEVEVEVVSVVDAVNVAVIVTDGDVVPDSEGVLVNVLVDD